MAPHKILVTGGGGYVGGTIIPELLSPKTGDAVEPSDIIAIVRNQDVAAKMRKLGIEVSSVSLTDEPGIESLVLEKGVDLVVHCASAMDSSVAIPLIKALAAQKKKTGKQVHFIQTSGSSCVADVTGWTHGLVRDTDNVYELEKTIKQPYFIRDTNIAVYELAQALDVPLSIVVPPLIYGEGSGEGGRQSTLVPMYIQSAISLKTMHKHKTRATWPVVHVNDLAEFYVLLIQKILGGNAATADVAGYFFPVAHFADMWDLADALAKPLYEKGLVYAPKAVAWPSDEAASEALGMPLEFIPLIYRCVQQIEPIRPQQLGWEPKWDNKNFLASRADDVDVFLKYSDASSAGKFQSAVQDAHKG